MTKKLRSSTHDQIGDLLRDLQHHADISSQQADLAGLLEIRKQWGQFLWASTLEAHPNVRVNEALTEVTKPYQDKKGRSTIVD